MGFDIYGLKPTDEIGEYFQNNIWWWRPIGIVIEQTCHDILTEEQLEGLQMNNGTEYSQELSERIVERLEKLITDEPEWKLKAKVDVIQNVLSGGRKNEFDDGEKLYPFDMGNFKSFIKFVKNSGGFQIS